MNSSLLRHGLGLIVAALVAGCAPESGTDSGFDSDFDSGSDDSEENVGEAQGAVAFNSLGGFMAPGSGPGAASWGSGRLDVFVRGGNDALYHKASGGFGAPWTDWTNLGGTLTSDPAAVSWGPGRLDVVVRGGDDGLWHKAYDTSYGWSDWESLGGVASSGPAIASWGPGRLDVFVNGGAQLWHRAWDVSTSAWSGWESLGAAFTSDPAAVSWGPGRLDVFGRGADNTLLHRAWTPGGWSGWESLGGDCSSGPAVASDGVGRLDVFVRGGSQLWRKSYRPGAWTDWASLGTSITSDPDAVGSGPNQVALFGRGEDGSLVHSYGPYNPAPNQVPQGHVGQFFHARNGTNAPPLSYGRGVGTPIDSCPAGQEKDGALCYPPCDPGYYGVGPVCWQSCPSGFTDTGAFCTYSGAPLIDCSWSWSSWSCSCPSNYTNIGLLCAANTIAKSSYGRGAGSPLVCAPHLEYDAGLCYTPCTPAYDGVGPVCWLDDVDDVCHSLYDSTLASGAVTSGLTMSYGFGLGISALVNHGWETGVIYGNNGEYGCYTQHCTTATTNVSFDAWGSFAQWPLGFGSVAGDSAVTAFGGSASLPGWPLSVNATTASVKRPGGQSIGSVQTFGLGASLVPSSVPVSQSTLECQTSVTQLW